MFDGAPKGIVPGAILGDKYRIERVLASGGQGTVVEATHLRLRQAVAIKFPHVDARGPERQERLFREARAAFRLHSEHVCRVIDIDVVDGAPFIVMELLRGVDLRAVMAKRGALPCDEAVGLLLQACEGVAEAHDLNIVHRDLKPSNLFLVDRGDIAPLLKVLDFGIAKKVTAALPSSEDPDLTEPMRMMGSPRYMAPEQARDSRLADVRTDIWALGVILQELLTGKALFRAPSNADVLALVLTKHPTPVTLLRPEVPSGVERVLLRCLQKQPEHRFPNVREMARQLAPFAPPWAAASVDRLMQPPRVPLDPAAAEISAVSEDKAASLRATPMSGQSPAAPAGAVSTHRLSAGLDTTTTGKRKLGTTFVLATAGLLGAFAAVGGIWRMSSADGHVALAVRAPSAPTAPIVMPVTAPDPSSLLGPLPVVVQLPAPEAAPPPALPASPPPSEAGASRAPAPSVVAVKTAKRSKNARAGGATHGAAARPSSRRRSTAAASAPRPTPVAALAQTEPHPPSPAASEAREPPHSVANGPDNPLDGRK